MARAALRLVMLAAAAEVAHTAPVGAQALSTIPTLRRQGTATQLIVDGAPFLVLAGELGNSTASSREYLRPFWARLRALHLNTVLAPLSWERTEPAEGRFDFATVDALIADARANDMRLVVLWFGSWKNSMSSYAPSWVKTHQERFPRTESTRGQGQEILSPFDSSNVNSDARAFGAVMRHLRAIDGTRHTVLMVQVENEIGMIPEAPGAPRAALGGGIIIATAPNEFLIAGTGIVVTFAPLTPGDPVAGILSAQEGRFVNGRWMTRRWLNGDQTHQGRHVRLVPNEFSIQRVQLYRYR